MVDKPKIWTPSFTVLTAINFVSALIFYLLLVTMVEYTMITYDASYSAAGLMVTAYVISSLLTRLFLGGKIDVWGLKRSIIIGTAVNLVAAMLYFIEGGFVFLLLTRALHGVGFGIASGALAASAALLVPPERRGEGIGYFSMAQALATGVGPFVAIMLTSNGNYLSLFIFSAVVSAAALAGTFFIKVPEIRGASSKEADKAGEAERTEKEPLSVSRFIQISVLPLAIPLLLVLVCYSGITSFLTVFSQERNLVEAASLYFIVYSAAILLTRPPVGRRVDKKGENSVIYLTFASLAVGLVVLALSFNGASLLISAALAGFGIGCTQSTVQTAIVRITPKNELGRANSTFFMSMDLGSGIGPVIIGLFIPLVGYTAIYLALAVLALVACLVYHMAYGRKQ